MVVLSETGTPGLQVAFWPEQSAPLPVVLVVEDEAHQGLNTTTVGWEGVPIHQNRLRVVVMHPSGHNVAATHDLPNGGLCVGQVVLVRAGRQATPAHHSIQFRLRQNYKPSWGSFCKITACGT